ncbi:hypothetical protein [Mycoplasmopsis glycophila]|uniref:Uncharacterized protein n=1 Tax=Mycoplasmopsis glycophila TaxID=171285 RepID=A0A449AVB4_9BACT|nr:hypothetical protein [Mycoplasmopsis glycophila]VEU70445.1 Uncharacterised protein [Mycoplasmopsis glycophila]
MILLYKNADFSPISINQNKERAKGTIWSFFKSLGSFFFELVAEFVIDAISIAVPLAGIPLQLIKAGARFVKNVIFEWVQYGTISWKRILISTATEIASLGMSKAIKALSKVSRTFAISKQAISFIKSGFSEKVAKVADILFKKTFKSNNQVVNKLKNLGINSAGQIISKGKEVYEIIKNPLSLIMKGQSKLLEMSKKQIAKRIDKIAVEHWEKVNKKLINQGLLKAHTAERYAQALHKYNKGQIYFLSSWISGVRVENPEYWVQNQMITFFLYFKREATSTLDNPKGKRPLQLVLPLKDFYEFIYAPSKGRYYLDKIAWGWELGKGLRDLSKISFKNLDEFKNSDEWRRFRLNEYANEYMEQLKNDQQITDKIRKHRTNKTQKIAYVQNGESGLTLGFAPNVQSAKSHIHTSQAIYRVKRPKRR